MNCIQIREPGRNVFGYLQVEFQIQGDPRNCSCFDRIFRFAKLPEPAMSELTNPKAISLALPLGRDLHFRAIPT